MSALELPSHAISLIQPWAWLMLELPPGQRKDVENRRWNTKVRGEVWVHASKGMTREDYESAIETAREILGDTFIVPGFAAVKRGGIVGRFRIVDVVPPLPVPYFGERRRWHFPDQFGFVVTDAKPVEFVPCKGALGFWRVPADVLEQLRSSA